MRTSHGSRAGGALLLAVIAFVFMAGIGGALFSLAMSGQRTTAAASNADAAFHVAEAGIDDAINKMRAYQSDPDNEKADYAVIGQPVKLEDGSVVNQISGSMHGGSYTVTISPAYAGLGEYKITSIGSHKTSSGGQVLGEKRGIETWIVAEETDGAFKYGLFGDLYLDAGGTINTDGYNSTKGSYAAQAVNTVGKTKVANMTGHVGSNGNVDVSGSSVIYGNATPGPKDAVTGGGKVYGTTTSAKTTLDLALPDFTPPAGTTVLKATPLTLNAGTYSISSLKAAAKQKLTINGDVTLYVNGDFDWTGQTQLIINGKLTVYQNSPSGSFKIAGGSTLNKTNDPHAFMYYTNVASGTLTGNADFYGTVYAPKSAIKVAGTSGLFGSTISKSIDIQGTPFFHYDESLGEISTGTISLNVKSFQQFVP